MQRLSLIFATVFLSSFPLSAVDLIAPGSEWETEVQVIDSGVEGPVFLLVGGIHGDEPAGAIAAEQIRHWPVVKGKLVVIPRANRVALAAKSRRFPGLEKDAGDLNRHFPKSDGPDETDSPLAGALWEYVKTLEPDWVIDLHEGKAVHRIEPESVGSTIIFREGGGGDLHFEHALAAVNASIGDPEKLFVGLGRSGGADGSLVRAARERLGAYTAIFETTVPAWTLGVRVRQHRLMVHRILRNLGMVTGEPDDLVYRDEGDDRLAVAIYVGPGVGGTGPSSIDEKLSASPDRFIARYIGPEEVRNGALDQFDVVVFPGGSGSRQAEGLGEKGRENVREFVAGGSGYVGICAGCYLACENYSWSLRILDARTKSSKWRRGVGPLELGFEAPALELLAMTSPTALVKYANGPVMEPAGSPGIPDFTTLAVFKTEIAENDTPAGIQIDTPAILTGPFGKGRVVGISPHPEQSDGLRDLVPRLIEWSAGRDLTGSGQ